MGIIETRAELVAIVRRIEAIAHGAWTREAWNANGEGRAPRRYWFGYAWGCRLAVDILENGGVYRTVEETARVLASARPDERDDADQARGIRCAMMAALAMLDGSAHVRGNTEEIGR